MSRQIYYATGNVAKFNEVSNYLKKHEPSIKLVQFTEKLSEIQTKDQKAIAIHKSRRAWEQLHKPLLVDDSGIYFERYGTFPGTLTKHVFEGIGFDGIFKLVKPHDRAYFLLHMVYVNGMGHPYGFEGRCEGQIIKPKEFEYQPGFPYDSIFMPNGSDKTYAELRTNYDVSAQY
ncbi:non-canonical purine NTP pyrophosphatase, partial [Candidatus Babeliales bacterium]|nr:non-canonical purine NTP pyrophosphatase [Candidatus Babeliales bacterium]